MFKSIYLSIILSLICFQIYTLEITPKEKFVLEKFFKTMIEKSEGGYVLYDAKPVCINSFYLNDYFVNESERHRISVYLREGIKVLKKLNLKNDSQNNIIIHVYDQEDSVAKNHVHILFINKKLFLDTVRANLSLFQYVLGPEVTPMGLLNILTDAKETFHHVLKQDKVLIGTLLGFGIQNSLYVSRIENLQEAIFAPENPPFKTKLSQLSRISEEFKAMLLYRESTNYKDKSYDLMPSFSFLSLQDEIKQLCQKIELSSDKLVQNEPQFIFGHLKEDKESYTLISKLEEAQLQISNVLQSDKFLEQILHIIYPHENVTIDYVTENDFQLRALYNLSDRSGYDCLVCDESLASAMGHDCCSKLNHAQISQLSKLVAANIWQVIKDENKDYQQAFIKGMNDANEDKLINLDQDYNSSEYEKLKIINKAQENIVSADQFFNDLDKNDTYICQSPQRLYYKVIQNGHGKILDKQTRVTIQYVIKTPNDEVLADTWMSSKPVQVNLIETVPGFAWGLKGMNVGEIREFYIHPCLAYGLYTTLEKGIYLKVHVQLLDTQESDDEFPPLIALKFESSEKINHDYKELAQKVGYVDGFRIWKHYGTNKSYDLKEILNLISEISLGLSVDLENNQNIINHLHWKIYQEIGHGSI